MGLSLSLTAFETNIFMNAQPPQLKDPPNPFPIPLGVLVAPLDKLDEELGAPFAFCAGPTPVPKNV